MLPSSIVVDHISLLHCCRMRGAEVPPPLLSFMLGLGFAFNGKATVARGGLLLHHSCSCVVADCRCAMIRYGA